LRTAYELGTQCLAAAQCLHDAEGLLGAQQTLGLISLALGEFVVSRAYLEQGIALVGLAAAAVSKPTVA